VLPGGEPVRPTLTGAYVSRIGIVRLPDPYDFELSTERFRAFGRDLANLWHEGGLHRVVDGREIRIERVRGGVQVEPLDSGSELVVRKLLGAEFDLAGFYAWAAEVDETLGRVCSKLAGFRPPLAPDPFETLVTSITAQQVSMYAAVAIRNRMLLRLGEPAEHALAFPSRERVAAVQPEELVDLGFSRRKGEYVIGLARSELDLDTLAELPDAEVKVCLAALPGIGEWTADWFLARHLARPEAWPAGDLALRKAVAAFYRDGRAVSTEEVRAIGARFAPFQNLTAHYLLTALRVAPPS
jgi:DNA-3-methyladenine glycosylase II